MNHLCELCGREVSFITQHHLVPKEEGGAHLPKAALCQPCHSTIHHTFSNKELAREYNSLEKLKNAGNLQKYLKWIRKQSVEKLRNK